MPERDGVDRMIEQWSVEWPELDVSPIGVIGRISRLSRELEARLEPVYREHGLEHGWHDVLATLRRSGPPYRLRATEFTAHADDQLERRDEAPRPARAGRPDRAQPRPAGPPRHADRPHARGRKLIDGVTEAHLANERRLLEALSAEEREQLSDLLRKLLLGLPPHQTSPSRQSTASAPDRSSGTPSTGST